MIPVTSSASDIAPAPSGGLAWLFGNPKRLAIICIAVLTATGWLALGLMAASSYSADTGFAGLIDAICRPSLGHGGLQSGTVGDALGGLAVLWLMWCAMALAMMLPSAAPMIYTYAEIAETAARKNERVVSPLVITAGYASIWLAFAAIAASLQWALQQTGALDPFKTSVGPLMSGALFVAAGTYQFTELKHACLTQCQRPFPFFFTNWSTTGAGVFRLGFQQGVYCLGCCWAMMALMFAVGTMNVVWMAALGIAMTIEKMTTSLTFTKLLGAVMLAAGAMTIGATVIAHWPVHPG